MLHRFVIMTLVALIPVIPAAAEPPAQSSPSGGELALRVADAQKANLSKLQAYRWRVKTDLQSGGASQATIVNEISIDADGKPKSQFVTAEAGEEAKPGVRGRRQEKALTKEAEYLGKVMAQSFAYMFMSKGTLVDMFDSAKITTEGGVTTVLGKDIYTKGDEVIMTLDAATLLTKNLKFTTTMSGDVIQGEASYEPLKDGTNRMTRSVVDVPSKQARVVSESSDFVKPEN